MNASHYYAWVVMDMENWGGRPGAVQARMQDALRGIITRAMSASAIGEHPIRQTSRGDGVILGISTEVPKETITSGFLKSLNRELWLYADECPPEEVMRLRVALHAGDALDGGDEWAGNAVVVACRLVDSEILHRVLTAASSSVLAIIVSDQWYDAVLREGWADPTGYDQVTPHVKDYYGGAWIKVPGLSRPPGLRPSDRPPHQEPRQKQSRQAPPAHRPNQVPGGSPITVHGAVRGDIITGNKYGDTFYGSGGKTVIGGYPADPGKGHRR